MAVRLVPRMSEGWLDIPPQNDAIEMGQRVSEWRRERCSLADLERQVIRIDGLDSTITDVFVRVDFNNGRLLQSVLSPGDPQLALAAGASGQQPIEAYFLLGVRHIIHGIDHLAFVLGLMLLVASLRRLLASVTAFTLAHSTTLVATALGLFNPWPALIEALVALSIVIVAAEAWHLNRGKQGVASRWPESVAFGFGLLHGFAFAGSLAAIGLPKGEAVKALILFNLGVEAGQILFIAALLLLAIIIQQFSWIWERTRDVLPYAIGSLAGFWFIERTSAIFSIP